MKMKMLGLVFAIFFLNLSCQQKDTPINDDIDYENLAKNGFIFSLVSPSPNSTDVPPYSVIVLNYYYRYFDDCDGADCIAGKRVFFNPMDDLKIIHETSGEIEYQLSKQTDTIHSTEDENSLVVQIFEPLIDGKYTVQVKNIKNGVISAFNFSVNGSPFIKNIVVTSDEAQSLKKATITFSEIVNVPPLAVCYKELCNEEGCDFCNQVTIYGDGTTDVQMPLVRVSTQVANPKNKYLVNPPPELNPDYVNIDNDGENFYVRQFNEALEVTGFYYWGAL